MPEIPATEPLGRDESTEDHSLSVTGTRILLAGKVRRIRESEESYDMAQFKTIQHLDQLRDDAMKATLCIAKLVHLSSS